MYHTLLEEWQDDKPTFNFSECNEAAVGEDTWDVGYRQHLANGQCHPAMHM